MQRVSPFANIILVTALCFAPLHVFAEAPRAGFPTGALWTSKSSALEGEHVGIFSVVFNSTSASVSGAVAFSVDGTVIAEVPFTLEAGANKIVAASWPAAKGTHTFFASLNKFEGAGVNPNMNQQTSSVSVQVKEAPPPPPPVPPSPTQAAIDQVSDISSRVVASTTPIVTSVAQKLYEKAEDLRESGLEYARNLSNASRPAASSDEKAITSTNVAGFSSSTDSNPASLISRISQLAAPALLFTFGSKAAFYPILLFLILFVLWLLKRWATRPRF